MAHFIRLHEIIRDGEGTSSQPMLVPVDFIGKITTGKLEKSGPHIIGSTPERELTLIMLKNNVPIFVEETLDQLETLLASK